MCCLLVLCAMLCRALARRAVPCCVVQLTFTKPHILLLDEPSNHLDIDAVDALIQGLALFKGGVLMVGGGGGVCVLGGGAKDKERECVCACRGIDRLHLCVRGGGGVKGGAGCSSWHSTLGPARLFGYAYLLCRNTHPNAASSLCCTVN